MLLFASYLDFVNPRHRWIVYPAILDFVYLDLREGIIAELLNHKGVFKHFLKFWEAFTSCVFASQFCSWLCLVILAWKYHSLNSQNIVEHLTRVFLYIARLCPRQQQQQQQQ